MSVISKPTRVGVDATSSASHSTKEQEVALERVKASFPSCADLGLGRTTMEEHVIEVVDEHLPVKQRHYSISPAIQKLILEELD